MHRLQQLIIIAIILNILLPYWIQTHTKFFSVSRMRERYFLQRAHNNASLRLMMETMPVMTPPKVYTPQKDYESLEDDYYDIAEMLNHTQTVVHLSALPIQSTRFRRALNSRRAPRLV